MGSVVFFRHGGGGPHHSVLVVVDWREGALLVHERWVTQHGRVCRLAPGIGGGVCGGDEGKVNTSGCAHRKSSVTRPVLIGQCPKAVSTDWLTLHVEGVGVGSPRLGGGVSGPVPIVVLPRSGHVDLQDKHTHHSLTGAAQGQPYPLSA